MEHLVDAVWKGVGGRDWRDGRGVVVVVVVVGGGGGGVVGRDRDDAVG